jgi:membrane-associated phospholipid phosphatase
VCAALTLTSALAAGSARADEPSAPPVGPIPGPLTEADRPPLAPLRWDWPRFSTADYIVTGTAAGATLAMAIIPPQSRHTRGGVLFDEGARNALRIRDMTARYVARDASDVGLSLVVTWPVFVDSLITAWWYRGSREVAEQMALIDLEALAITAAVQGTTNVLASRERPYGRTCDGELAGDKVDCDGSIRYRSFFSGHSAQSFTAAALICVHHFEHALLGPPYDALSCATGYAVAATTATLRVVSDMHYASDAITGALMGTVIGYGVPLLHYRNRSVGSATLGGIRLQLVPSSGGLGVTGVF